MLFSAFVADVYAKALQDYGVNLQTPNTYRDWYQLIIEAYCRNEEDVSTATFLAVNSFQRPHY
jgi:hypothetical protein